MTCWRWDVTGRIRTCGNSVSCVSGRAVKLSERGTDVTGFDPVDAEALCCDISCATWGGTHECANGTSFLAAVAAETAADITEGCCSSRCSPGSRVDRNGRCELCQAGMFAAEENAAQCSACPFGTHAAGGASTCAVCGAGTFDSDFNPATACISCPAGLFTRSPGFCDGECPVGT